MPERNRDTARMWAYHEATAHTPERLRARRGGLDWASMPDPFRRYEGAPLVDLPAHARAPAAQCLDILRGSAGTACARTGAEFLSSLFFHSAAISASKFVPQTGYRYALRVNPSSGNLHPTEFHFIARGLAGWEDGLYHYQPAAHMAERRGRGHFMPPWCDAPLLLGLTTIAWREAWKYRERAYRYCLLDAGHAWQALSLAARALGARVWARGVFSDAQAAALFAVEDEWPLLLLEIDPPVERAPSLEGREWSAGVANRLSQDELEYPEIVALHEASCLAEPGLTSPEEAPACWPAERADSAADFAAVVRRRRSALDFVGGSRTITLAQLGALMDAAAQPFEADWDGRWIDLYLFVHRVEGMEAGLYRWRPAEGRLELLRRGDQRTAAAGLSLGQDLAGNSCVTFSMAARLGEAAALLGNRAYRFVHFEAGALGQRFYLAAEALGFQSTGIGAFFDEAVREYLGLRSRESEVVYHLAVGFAVFDPRLAG